MYQTVDQFIKTWTIEAGLTEKTMNQLTDDSLKQEIAPGYWSLGKIAWHLVTVVGVIAKQTGLEFECPEPNAPVPSSAKEIVSNYQKVSKGLAEAIQKQWKDEDIVASSMIFGNENVNGATLSMIVSHQIHHRGQMTVLMHQAGVRVPGIYGPSKDDRDGK
ncbi:MULTISPECIES: DinB family protein [Bacillus]|uniref:DinB family protein n=1 Tax=Bacillus TaxID=1386 RepID=UPI0002DD0C0D|nr:MULTISPECIES: DinB family protein [Bacillus]